MVFDSILKHVLLSNAINLFSLNVAYIKGVQCNSGVKRVYKSTRSWYININP